MIIGFSTGCIWKYFEHDLLKGIELIRATGANAIEISTSSKERSSQLADITREHLIDFEYISIHGPGVNKEVSKEILDDIQTFHDRIPINGAVFHPDTVEDFRIFDAYSFPCLFENMDSRKIFGKTCEDMQQVFDRDPSYGFCLDVNHIYTLDTTMKLTQDFMHLFSARLREVHFSGARPDETGFLYHRPMYETRQDVILDATPRNIPIIIESDFSEYAKQDLADGLQQEFEYIRSKLTL